MAYHAKAHDPGRGSHLPDRAPRCIVGGRRAGRRWPRTRHAATRQRRAVIPDGRDATTGPKSLGAQAQERRRAAERQRIDAALARLDEDELGWCATCGEEIAPARLAHDPSAAQCITCARVSV
ncbi:TraR/DksA family transcriptional regulator [Qipengyuania sp. DSG2-2]|uniref:TraR/DksA family transcriptional regulator n=1 Tax=Qipengyuania sp. DGS2-2 TaxID=3349631 RepID=UPI0036D406F6